MKRLLLFTALSLSSSLFAADKVLWAPSGDWKILTTTGQKVNLNDTLYTTQDGKVGIGVPSPTLKLDVAGSINLSTGNDYKINGITVLSSSSLGSGITSSSLTSVGTLGSLNVTGNLTVDTSTLKVDSVNNRVGVANASPNYPLDVIGNANLSTGSTYKINGTDVLSETGLGSGVTSSSLTSVGTLNTGLNIASGQTYKINNVSVLSGSSLGSGITSSSLTSVGTLGSLGVTGDLTVDTSTLKVDSTNNRVGIVNASPNYPLDVVGNANLSTGSTYKINGTDVLSSSALGSGVTSSSLTSVGTLGSLAVSGTQTVNTINEYTAGNGVAIKGNTNGTAPASGYVGQYISANGTITSINVGNIASISLPAGNWLVTGACNLTTGGSGATNIVCSVNNVSGTVGTYGYNQLRGGISTGSGYSYGSVTIANIYYQLSTTTTIYLVGCTEVAALTLIGYIRAFRMP